MNVTKLIALGAFILFLSPQMLFAQAFGEYGKTVGGAGPETRQRESEGSEGIISQ